MNPVRCIVRRLFYLFYRGVRAYLRVLSERNVAGVRFTKISRIAAQRLDRLGTRSRRQVTGDENLQMNRTSVVESISNRSEFHYRENELINQFFIQSPSSQTNLHPQSQSMLISSLFHSDHFHHPFTNSTS